MSGYCEGRVAIITGAGGGLGRAYAQLLGAEGAAVVVNDINPDTAQETADEINAAGGKAIADTGDITDYASSADIVRATIEQFGDLHVVVNNAGVCRDRMFTSLTEDDWDVVMAVHLKGHFCITSNAAKYWRGQSKSGESVDARIINTSSGAGLLGSVGQSNYSAAKGGILSLTLVQAAELERYGVTANALAPAARTGMTEDVFADMMKKPDGDVFDSYDPANVAPLVAWLASEKSVGVTGRCFEVSGGKISIADGWRTGPAVDRGAQWPVADIPAAYEKLKAEMTPPEKVYGT